MIRVSIPPPVSVIITATPSRRLNYDAPILEFIREARVMFDLCKLRALSDDCARPTKIDNNTNREGWLSPV